MRARRTETRHGAVLYPALAEAARRVGAHAVGLIDVAPSVDLNLQVDRVAITYDGGQTLGDPSSPVQLTPTLRGDRPIPTRAIPEVVARIGVGYDPTDPSPADGAAASVAAATPPLLLAGDPLEVLPDALARVPAAALPIVITTWALSAFSLDRRLRFLQRLDAGATDRTVAWVSIEGVGVAPAVPTMGDRPASGHSIVGLAFFEHAMLRAEAIGRCWSRGRWFSWLADPEH